MSSFICPPKHFNSVENSLHSLIGNTNFYVPYSLRNICPKFYNSRNYLIEDVEREISEIINTIKELNVLCVSLQYKHHYKGTLDDEIKQQLDVVKIKTTTKHLTPLGLYNALRCIYYQIEKEHLQELRELSTKENNAIKFLTDIIDGIAHYIIRLMPEDKTNTWCID